MKKLSAIEAVIGFILGAGLLNLASDLVNGVVLVPIEYKSSDIPSAWNTLTFHLFGRVFSLLGTVQAALVLLLITGIAVLIWRRSRRLVEDVSPEGHEGDARGEREDADRVGDGV